MAIQLDTTSRAGASKAAIVLVALGGDLAAPLLRSLRDEQIEAITREIVHLDDIADRERNDILAQCAEAGFPRRGSGGLGVDFARDLLARSIGTQRAADVLARVTPGKDEPFGFVKQT